MPRPSALVWACLLIALVAGCTRSDRLSTSPSPGYLSDTAAYTTGVDWSAAEEIVAELDSYSFTFPPGGLPLRAGKAYRLVLRNISGSRHTFLAPAFFRAIAVERLISEDAVFQAPYVEEIVLAPGEQKTLDFVAVTPGHYHIGCSVFLHEVFGMEADLEIAAAA